MLCLRVVRGDGSGTDFSYLHCISQCALSRKLEAAKRSGEPSGLISMRRAMHFCCVQGFG
ncbi:DUF3223 domain-containing protein [Bradyrhizobium valentinum]|uniref:DUF3223 domain-containing protein n=1 Tax=Bradyrhizobium valentinum TaxID=1518501 RepID=UPI0012E3A7F3